jgi:hypothetical protein
MVREGVGYWGEGKLRVKRDFRTGADVGNLMGVPAGGVISWSHFVLRTMLWCLTKSGRTETCSCRRTNTQLTHRHDASATDNRLTGDSNGCSRSTGEGFPSILFNHGLEL